MLKRILCLLVIVFLFCSCSKKNDKEIITFSSWGSVTEVKIINELIKDFEIKNPDIKILFQHIPQNYFQKIHLLLASSTAPDVIFINNLYLPVYSNFLLELDDIISKDEFYPQSIQVLSYNNKLLAAPRDISNFVFYYNKNLMGDLNPEWTFNDFINIVQRPHLRGMWNISFERDMFYASPYVMTLGFDDGINFYKKLEGTVAPLPADIGSLTQAQMFLDGKIGLYLSGRWMYPKLKHDAKFPVGIVTFPGIVPADASGWAISKTSKHKIAAIKFVKYMSSNESLAYLTETGLIVPARKSLSSKIKEKAFLDAIKKSKPNVVNKHYNKTRDLLNKKLFR